MTIGIAARGPHAGIAILEALVAVEAIGTGAIGGFVSLAAIVHGQLLRAETQTGGSKALFDGDIPSRFGDAKLAVLMSSGPNRPPPLSQFTPGDPAVGLVTGHRFPNVIGAAGLPLNLDVLDRMRQGAEPEAAVNAVLEGNPLADAGLIALGADGRLFSADGALLRSFEDRGGVTLQSGDGAVVSVLHNAILPYRGLALIAAETALKAMETPSPALVEVRLNAGLPIFAGSENAIDLDENNRVRSISVVDPRFSGGSWSFGLGYQARVTRDGIATGHLAYEPYLVANDGHLASIDGMESAWIGVLPELNTSKI